MPTFACTDNLDWNVERRPLYYIGANGEPVIWEERVAVVRSDNGKCLGSVSHSYETVQNKDLLSLINPMVEEGLLQIENMGYLNHGSRVFAQAKINQEYQVLGEDYRAYITLLNGHVGNASVAIGSTMYRVICGNTFAGAYNDISEKYRHSFGVNERVLESQAVINYVNNSMKTYADYMEKIATAPCSAAQFRKFLTETYQRDAEKIRQVEVLNNLFYNGAGNEGKTFHDAFAAVTDFSSNVSRKTTEGRFNYVNFGTGASINRRALRVALEMAAV